MGFMDKLKGMFGRSKDKAATETAKASDKVEAAMDKGDKGDTGDAAKTS